MTRVGTRARAGTSTGTGAVTRAGTMASRGACGGGRIRVSSVHGIGIGVINVDMDGTVHGSLVARELLLILWLLNMTRKMDLMGLFGWFGVRILGGGGLCRGDQLGAESRG